MFPLSAGTLPSGEPIEIRILHESHADELFQLIDSNRPALRQWLPWLDGSRTPADSASFIRESHQRYVGSNGFSAGIWIGAALAGTIGLHAIDTLRRSSSIGYWLDSKQNGRGIMTRACGAIITAAFEHYRLHRIEIRCATGNHRSCAIPERLGFAHDGILREAEWLYDHFEDLHVFSMLEQDWHAAK